MKRGLRGWIHSTLRQVVRDEMVESRHQLEVARQLDLAQASVARIEQQEFATAREAERDATLAQALLQLSGSINSLTEHLAADAHERALMFDSVEWLTRELVLHAFAPPPLPHISQAPLSPQLGTPFATPHAVSYGTSDALSSAYSTGSAHTVVGGTIEATRDNVGDGISAAVATPANPAQHPSVIDVDADTDIDIELLDADPAIDLRELLEAEELVAGTRVEVRSRFQQAWILGFEILEVVGDVHNRCYRLSRLSDHMALPVLFGHDDIRMVASPTHHQDTALT